MPVFTRSLGPKEEAKQTVDLLTKDGKIVYVHYDASEGPRLRETRILDRLRATHRGALRQILKNGSILPSEWLP